MSVLEQLKSIFDAVKRPTDKYYQEKVTSGALSKRTTVGTDFPGRAWRLKHLTVKISTAPTTSEALTLTRNVGAHRPSALLFSNNPSVGSITDIDQIWEGDGRKMLAGEEVTVAYANTDNNTVTVEITVEVL